MPYIKRLHADMIKDWMDSIFEMLINLEDDLEKVNKFKEHQIVMNYVLKGIKNVKM